MSSIVTNTLADIENCRHSVRRDIDWRIEIADVAVGISSLFFFYETRGI
jgi:hypothetical protein